MAAFYTKWDNYLNCKQNCRATSIHQCKILLKNISSFDDNIKSWGSTLKQTFSSSPTMGVKKNSYTMNKIEVCIFAYNLDALLRS